MEAKPLFTLPDGRMRPSEAARLIGLSVKTLATMRCNGTGPPYIKIRNRVYYELADLEKWIDDHGKQTSTSQTNKKGDPLCPN